MPNTPFASALAPADPLASWVRRMEDAVRRAREAAEAAQREDLERKLDPAYQGTDALGWEGIPGQSAIIPRRLPPPVTPAAEIGRAALQGPTALMRTSLGLARQAAPPALAAPLEMAAEIVRRAPAEHRANIAAERQREIEAQLPRGSVLGPLKPTLAPLAPALNLLDMPRREIGRPVARAAVNLADLIGDKVPVAARPALAMLLPGIGAPAAILGNLDTILDKAGVSEDTRTEVLSYLADPVNLVPVLGFTKAEDFAKAARAAQGVGRRYVARALESAPGITAAVRPTGLTTLEPAAGVVAGRAPPYAGATRTGQIARNRALSAGPIKNRAEQRAADMAAGRRPTGPAGPAMPSENFSNDPAIGVDFAAVAKALNIPENIDAKLAALNAKRAKLKDATAIRKVDREIGTLKVQAAFRDAVATDQSIDDILDGVLAPYYDKTRVNFRLKADEAAAAVEANRIWSYVLEEVPVREIGRPAPKVGQIGEQVNAFGESKPAFGPKEQQAGLGIGAGERPIETAGPLFAREAGPALPSVAPPSLDFKTIKELQDIIAAGQEPAGRLAYNELWTRLTSRQRSRLGPYRPAGAAREAGLPAGELDVGRAMRGEPPAEKALPAKEFLRYETPSGGIVEELYPTNLNAAIKQAEQALEKAEATANRTSQRLRDIGLGGATEGTRRTRANARTAASLAASERDRASLRLEALLRERELALRAGTPIPPVRGAREAGEEAAGAARKSLPELRAEATARNLPAGGTRKQVEDRLAAAGEAPPVEPPRPPAGGAGEPEDVLVEYINAAGARRPALVQERHEELRLRVAQAASRLQEAGADPLTAFKEARKELAGQLADPSFSVPGGLDLTGLQRQLVDAVGRDEIPFFVGNNASKGLELLAEGIVPPPFAVEAIGKKFPRVAAAIEELGEVFKVQRRVETVLARGLDIPISANGHVNLQALQGSLARSLPDASPERLGKVARRLVDGEALEVIVKRGGRLQVRPKIGFDGDILAAMEHDAKLKALSKAAAWQPSTKFDVQPRLGAPELDPFEEWARVLKASQEGLGPPPPKLTRTLHQMQLEAAARLPHDAALLDGPLPSVRAGQGQRAFPWEPGQSWPVRAAKATLDAVFALPKTFISSFDQSNPFRQSWVFSMNPRRVRQVAPALWTQMKVFTNTLAGDASLARRVNVDLRNRLGAYGTLARKLDVVELGTDAPLMAREESFLSNLAGRIPVLGRMIRASQDAFSVYGNKLRGDLFIDTVQGWQKRGAIFTQKDADALSDWLNIGTGRASMGNWEQIVPDLARVLFSPRLQWSRIQMPFAVFTTKSNLVRREIAADLIGTIMTTGGLAWAGQQAGLYDVEWDPRSSDFGKLRIGPSRVDIWGGNVQMARMVAQLLTGQRKGASGVLSGIDGPETISRFIQSKLSPTASFGLDVALGETYLGEEMTLDRQTLRRELFNRAVPFFIQDMVDAIRMQGAKGALLAAPGFFGVGVQTYETSAEAFGRQFKEATGQDWQKLPPSESWAYVEQHPELAQAYKDWQGSREGAAAKIAGDKAAGLEELGKQTDWKSPTSRVAFREQSGDIAGRAAIQYEQAKADGAIPDYGEQGEPWQKALDGYYTEIAKASDPLTLKTDYDLQERLERDYLATLSPEMRAIVLRETTFSRDPHYRELKEDRAKLEPFWAAQDDAFLDFRRNAAPKSSNTHVQAAQRFETMDEYREYIVAAVTKEADAKGLAPETRDYQIKQTVNKFFRDQKIDDAVQYYSSKVIAANTSLMDILRKWYPESVARYLLEVENKVEAGVR